MLSLSLSSYLWVLSCSAVVLVWLLAQLLNKSAVNTAVSLELATAWLGVGCVDASVSQAIGSGFSLWCLSVLSLMLAQVYVPVLSLSTLPFILGTWMLLGTWLILMPLSSGSFSLRLGTWLSSGCLASGSLLADVLSLTVLARTVYGLGNYLFQMTYFSFRLWLVFVLHAFCLGAFMELYSALLSLLPMDLSLGLLCLGLMLGLMLVGYLSIQLYVYLSFSVSFLSNGVLAWWNGLSLVAVSLVDLGSSNLLFFLSLGCLLSLEAKPSVGPQTPFVYARVSLSSLRRTEFGLKLAVRLS